ncbi:DNA primase [Candidatus Vallotiella sp. (ex Adelges kitamiensis)]|uniref:DNA primase n=1 Tax=Candidatus Vallotiella sp. (ex Adelges kitamiensis) TaxID=2864217 RepID=UPI001CE3827E|nr:DNA primase [Candidatus Vallotia sp. (ex Adelges kitamiensis)]
MIPHSFLQDLLNRVDIVDVVGKCVRLKKSGANFSGLCPFHNEKNPSFTVSPAKQFYHCFGCGVHGTALGFLMRYHGLTFPKAVDELAQSVGFAVPHETSTGICSVGHLPRLRSSADLPPTIPRIASTLVEIMRAASDYYCKQLRSAPDAIQYLKRRGVTGKIALHFGLGYAPNSWQNLQSVFTDYRDDALLDVGLVIISEKISSNGEAHRYDRFRQRIMFPIRNICGQVIGFGARVLDSCAEPKYLNSPETPLFSKRTELYGLFEARFSIREKGFVLVVEGYIDVVMLTQSGFPNAVATLGTTCTPVHIQKLMQQTDTVIFSFDGDRAGRRAARRALDVCLPHALDHRTLRFLFLPAEYDPDSYIRHHGAKAFAEQIKQAMPLSQFLLNEVLTDKNIVQPEERARALYEAKPLLQMMPSNALRAQIFHMLADQLSMSVEEVMQFCGMSRRAVPTIRLPVRIDHRYVTNHEHRALRNIIMYPCIVAMLDAQECETLATFSRQRELFSETIAYTQTLGHTAEYRFLKDLLLSSSNATIYEEILREILLYDENMRDLMYTALDEDSIRQCNEQKRIAAEEVRAVISKMRYDAYCKRLQILSQQTKLEGKQAREFAELSRQRAELKRYIAMSPLSEKI